MTSIAVAHAPLGRGGGERVCNCVIEALQDHYDVTFITDKAPEFAQRNEYYQTSVDSDRVSVRLLPPPIPWLFRTFSYRPWRLKQLAFNRYLRRIEPEYDLLVSTIDEFDLSEPSIQYIHYPKFYHQTPETNEANGLVYSVYDTCCNALYSPSTNPLANARILTNSEWTASVIEEGYDVSPEVVYPPVAVDRFETIPWNQREAGFVTVGRLSPEKRVLELIDLVATLVNRGHSLQYHIVGPKVNDRYVRRVERKAAQYEFVHVEGSVTNDELRELLSTHRYGLHGMENEHFGIVVAEMIAAGMLPFAHASGGPQEMLHSVPELLYDDFSGAVEAIETVLLADGDQRRLCNQLRGRAEWFSDERFKSEIREIVADTLS